VAFLDVLLKVANASIRIATPPPLLTVADWADEYLYLSPEDSAEAGKYRTDRAPYQREMLEVVSDPSIKEVVYCTSSQIGKTLLSKCIIGYHIHQDPGPIIVMQPTVKIAETFSKDRLSPMVRDTPVLKSLIADPKSRSSGNTIDHKALCLNTPIPTPSGWTTMGQLNVGDIVFDENGRQTTVINATEVFYGRDCYCVTFSDKTSIVADAEHLWGVWRWKVDKKNFEKPTQTRIYEVKKTNNLLDVRKDKNGRFKYAVAINRPLNCENADLPIDPYILGAWLGDGYSHRALICGDQDDFEMLELLIEAGAKHCILLKASVKPNGKSMNLYKLDLSPGEQNTCRYGHKKTIENLYANGGKGRGKCRQCILDRRKRMRRGDFSEPQKIASSILENLHLLGLTSRPGEPCNKHIPSIYLRASYEQRLALLQGLMDTDGSAQKTLRFTTSFNQLADGFCDLLRGLGIKYSMHTSRPTYEYEGIKRSGRVAYSFSFSTEQEVFRLTRKKNQAKSHVQSKNFESSLYKQIVSIDPCESVPVRCIGVDSESHLFLAGIGMIPTHNCFPGGHITMIGANAPSDLASRPIRIVFADEVDRYPPSAGSEGDPLFLARQRSVNFWNRKFIMASTPTHEGTSRIWREFERSDMRYYHLPCPHCGEFHTLKWNQIIWDNGDASTARAVCPVCGSIYENADKLKMLAHGEWRAQQENPRVAGFHISALYSPWQTFSDVVQEFLDKKDHPETLKTFINLQLGECYEDRSGEKIDQSGLMARREQWDAVPDDVVLITAGVDVQGDRLECTLLGWTAREQARVLHHLRLYGNPGEPKVWADLDALLMQPLMTEMGDLMSIRATCIDSGGHHTQEVYRFCGERIGRRVMAIKGRAGPHPIWPTKLSKAKLRHGASLHLVGVDTAKDVIHSSLSVIDPALPKYVAFAAGLPEDYFGQLVSERRITKFNKNGHPIRSWVKKSGDRNEALDCFCYALAALKMLESGRPHLLRFAKPRHSAPPPNRMKAPDTQTAPPRPPATRRTSSAIL
jgi:phage terminase large subunit GpA-like protein